MTDKRKKAKRQPARAVKRGKVIELQASVEDDVLSLASRQSESADLGECIIDKSLTEFASSLGRKPRIEPLGAPAGANIQAEPAYWPDVLGSLSLSSLPSAPLFKVTTASSTWGTPLRKAMHGQRSE